MDNVSHSLAGLLLAEATVQLRARLERTEPTARFRSVAAVSSLVAANLPDSDLLYTGVGASRLSYMLQHRGYTHTVALAIVGAVLVWCVGLLAIRWRMRSTRSTEDARWLFGLLLVSTLSHLVLDWTNSYGIHPFWPVDNRWRYGDAVFIVEPWLWVVSIPVLVAATTRRWGQVALSLLLVAGLLLAWRVPFVAKGAAAALTIGAVLSVALVYRLRPGARVAAGILGWIIVTVAMALGAAKARWNMLAALRQIDPRSQTLDVVVTPLPANPLCMSVITVERASEQSGTIYRASTARVSAAPWFVSAARCGSRDVSGSGIGPSPRPSSDAVQWDGEWTGQISQLAMMVRESCTALAAMRFIRAPIWRFLDDSTVVLGDLRFGAATGNGFTDVVVPLRSTDCPRHVPPWIPPREDLVRGTP
jgi:inner membrane protein